MRLDGDRIAPESLEDVIDCMVGGPISTRLIDEWSVGMDSYTVPMLSGDALQTLALVFTLREVADVLKELRPLVTA